MFLLCQQVEGGVVRLKKEMTEIGVVKQAKVQRRWNKKVFLPPGGLASGGSKRN